MPLLDQNTFIVELGKLFDNSKTSGSVYVNIKMVEASTKVKNDPSKTPVTEPRCLLRASDGSNGRNKVKFSTIIAAKDVPQFSKTFAVIVKSHAEGLKKKEKKKKTKTTNNKI